MIALHHAFLTSQKMSDGKAGAQKKSPHFCGLGAGRIFWNPRFANLTLSDRVRIVSL